MSKHLVFIFGSILLVSCSRSGRLSVNQGNLGEIGNGSNFMGQVSCEVSTSMQLVSLSDPNIHLTAKLYQIGANGVPFMVSGQVISVFVNNSLILADLSENLNVSSISIPISQFVEGSQKVKVQMVSPALPDRVASCTTDILVDAADGSASGEDEEEEEVLPALAELDLDGISAPAEITVPFSKGYPAQIDGYCFNSAAGVLKVNGSMVGGQSTVQSHELILANNSPAPISYRLSMTCIPLAGAPIPVTRSSIIHVNPAPSANLSVDKTLIAKGESVNLSWNSQFASGGCSLSDGVTTSGVALSGSLAKSNIQASQTTYTLVCIDQYQGIASRAVTVTAVSPTLTVSASSTEKQSTETLSVSWSSTDTTGCTLSGGGLSGSGASGSVSIVNANLRTTTTYTVTCTSLSGNISKSVTISVPGHWYQANDQYCPTFCSGQSMASVPSTEDATCLSGEVRSSHPSASHIVYHRTWGGVYPNTARSHTRYTNQCYRAGQKVDRDRSDKTVACFCR